MAAGVGRSALFVSHHRSCGAGLRLFRTGLGRGWISAPVWRDAGIAVASPRLRARQDPVRTGDSPISPHCRANAERRCCASLTCSPLFAILMMHASRATPSGCTTGRPASPRWTTTAWCVRWSGGWSGRRDWPCRNGFAPGHVPGERRFARSFCASSTSASWPTSDEFLLLRNADGFPPGAPRGPGLQHARSSRSERWKKKFAARTPSFCASPRRCTRLIRKTIWPMRAGFRRAAAAPWCCCRTGIPTRWPTPRCAAS